MAVQIDAMNAQYGTKYNYIIPCNLYGENDNFFHSDKMHFVTALLQKLKESNGSIQLLGTGKPLRQFMHTDDLARIIKRVVDEDITESFNAAPDFNMSIKEMAEEAIDALCDKDVEINWTKPELDGQYRKDVSSEKLLSLLPDFKFTSFREGVKRVWKTLN
jgi:GDP-L-fucose synthase